MNIKRSIFTMGMLLAFILFRLSPTASAQQIKANSWAHIGFEMPSYTGDLNSYAQFNSAFTGGFILNRKNNFNGQLSILIGTVKGENRELDIPPGAEAPNRFFSSSLIGITYHVNYYFVKKPRYSFYIGQGIGFLRFNPKDEQGNELSGISATRAEGETYRNIALSLPTKLGARYLFPNQFGMSVETGWHNLLTDYLDNISELGQSGNDNILFIRISLLVPLNTSDN